MHNIARRCGLVHTCSRSGGKHAANGASRPNANAARPDPTKASRFADAESRQDRRLKAQWEAFREAKANAEKRDAEAAPNGANAGAAKEAAPGAAGAKKAGAAAAAAAAAGPKGLAAASALAASVAGVGARGCSASCRWTRRK